MTIFSSHSSIISGYWRLILFRKITSGVTTSAATFRAGILGRRTVIHILWVQQPLFFPSIHVARPFANILVGWNVSELRERDICWRSGWTRTGGRRNSNGRSGSSIVGILINPLRNLGRAFSTGLEQDTALLTSVWRWWC